MRKKDQIPIVNPQASALATQMHLQAKKKGIEQKQIIPRMSENAKGQEKKTLVVSPTFQAGDKYDA